MKNAETRVRPTAAVHHGNVAAHGLFLAAGLLPEDEVRMRLVAIGGSAFLQQVATFLL